MFFKRKYTYCLVRFDDERTYWYRSNNKCYYFDIGMKVIVPVTNNGIWKIGTIVEVEEFFAENVPYPLVKTKGIVGKVGFFAKARIEIHNNQISNSQYPPLDISISTVETKNGIVEYCTCSSERDYFRKQNENCQQRLVIIENYPVANESDVPKEALDRLNRRLKKMRDLEFERENSFMELMEDLDQYN